MSAFFYRHKNLSIKFEVEWFSYCQLWLMSLRHFLVSKKDYAKWKKINNVTSKRKRNKVLQEIEIIEIARLDFSTTMIALACVSCIDEWISTNKVCKIRWCEHNQRFST